MINRSILVVAFLLMGFVGFSQGYSNKIVGGGKTQHLRIVLKNNRIFMHYLFGVKKQLKKDFNYLILLGFR